jgi:hypothetical protein
MSTQPEALRLVEVSPYLENSERGAWIIDVKAELRRLHEENAELREANETFGRRQVWWNDRMFALEQQRDALLEALAALVLNIDAGGASLDAMRDARAAIKAVEEGK